MYVAELRGKLSSRVERMEDILTSNVFSFFKYSERNVFLRGYLKMFGLDVSVQEAKNAEFLFWPVYEDGTEPDLVIIVGNYYLLIEAKYFSEFGGETTTTKAQLIREVENGKLEAANYGKVFKLIAITADYYYKKDKFTVLPPSFFSHVIWTNWQLVASFVKGILEKNTKLEDEVRLFGLDLCELLDKKNLRGFEGYESLHRARLSPEKRAFLFFNATTAKFCGDFIGFMDSLSFDKKIVLRKTIFLTSQRKHFASLGKSGKLRRTGGSIFYRGVRSYE